MLYTPLWMNMCVNVSSCKQDSVSSLCFLSHVILLCFVLLSQTISRWAHLDSVHVQQNIESSHSKDSPLIIHTLKFSFLKKTMLYSFHTFTVSLSCPESEIDENFLAVNWGTYWKADLSDPLWFYETIFFWLVKSRLTFPCENAKDLPLPHLLHPSSKCLKIEMIKLLSFSSPQVCRSNSLISNFLYKKEECPSKERGNIKLLEERSQVMHFAYSFLIECVLSREFYIVGAGDVQRKINSGQVHLGHGLIRNFQHFFFSS